MSNDAAMFSQFSAALHQAIDNSHLPLTQIVSQLSERGYRISRTTLSQWQTGASLPRRTSSILLIRELENLLTLPPQSLTSLLDTVNTNSRIILSHPQKHSQSKHARGNSGSVPTYIDAAHEEHFHSFTQIVDSRREVIRETIEEHLSVSADFLTVDQSLSTLVRIPDTDKPTLHTTAWWTKNDILPDKDDIGIYDIKGAYVSEVWEKNFGDDLAKIICLEFPDYATSGNLHNVSYKISFRSDKPMTETTERIFSQKLRYYSCAVTFEGEAPPVLQYVLTHTDTENPDVSHATIVREMRPHNGSVQVTLEDIEYGTGVFRWH